MAENSNLEIVSASSDHVEWIISMARKEGWNPGDNDAIAFQQADPSGYFVGLINGKPVCCVAGVKFNHIAIIGYYVVVKEHRGQGHGIRIFQHAMNYLNGYNIRVDGLLIHAPKYQNSGFKMAHVNVRYTGAVDNSTISCPFVCAASSVPFDKILQYDARFYADERKHFLAGWINTGTTDCLAYMDKDTVKGFGAIRKSVNGYRVGPLYAETTQIAEILLKSLCQHKSDCRITLDFPETNNHGKALAEKLKLVEVFKFGTLYTGEAPNVDLLKIYSFTCH
ncbi:Uncharacterized protein F36G3.2 [Trichoplax sp. H2]|nr:Uncharacterized protein F36G3.2 [Trichoplax sp. H2]|eukprot:RDD37799.1 Uncharacterized protein F36G3.2 [Trichoplax sp. H2]